LCWFFVARKTASHPRSRGTDSEPAVPAWAHCTVGVGPALLSPGSAPVRWLLMDGYVYDIRDDQDHPPWQEGRPSGAVTAFSAASRPCTGCERQRRPAEPELPRARHAAPTSNAGRARRSAARGRIAGQADYAKPASLRPA
jgi:hypothetical protein